MMIYVIFLIAIVQLFTIKEVIETPVGDYTSRGGIIKICEGSEEVCKYLGI